MNNCTCIKLVGGINFFKNHDKFRNSLMP